MKQLKALSICLDNIQTLRVTTKYWSLFFVFGLSTLDGFAVLLHENMKGRAWTACHTVALKHGSMSLEQLAFLFASGIDEHVSAAEYLTVGSCFSCTV